jgi:hypothetical protein
MENNTKKDAFKALKCRMVSGVAVAYDFEKAIAAEGLTQRILDLIQVNYFFNENEFVEWAKNENEKASKGGDEQ